MPLNRGTSRAAVSQNIREMMDAGHPQKQAVAAALRQQRVSRKKKKRKKRRRVEHSVSPVRRGPLVYFDGKPWSVPFVVSSLAQAGCPAWGVALYLETAEFADDEGTEWKTIGGSADDKGHQHAGGSPIKIDKATGEVKGGSIPKGMIGKKVGEVGKALKAKSGRGETGHPELDKALADADSLSGAKKHAARAQAVMDHAKAIADVAHSGHDHGIHDKAEKILRDSFKGHSAGDRGKLADKLTGDKGNSNRKGEDVAVSALHEKIAGHMKKSMGGDKLPAEVKSEARAKLKEQGYKPPGSAKERAPRKAKEKTAKVAKEKSPISAKADAAIKKKVGGMSDDALKAHLEEHKKLSSAAISSSDKASVPTHMRHVQRAAEELRKRADAGKGESDKKEPARKKDSGGSDYYKKLSDADLKGLHKDRTASAAKAKDEKSRKAHQGIADKVKDEIDRRKGTGEKVAGPALKPKGMDLADADKKSGVSKLADKVAALRGKKKEEPAAREKKSSRKPVDHAKVASAISDLANEAKGHLPKKGQTEQQDEIRARKAGEFRTGARAKLTSLGLKKMGHADLDKVAKLLGHSDKAIASRKTKEAKVKAIRGHVMQHANAARNTVYLNKVPSPRSRNVVFEGAEATPEFVLNRLMHAGCTRAVAELCLSSCEPALAV